MINWAEINEDFLAVAKDYQDRYDGKGHFRKPGEEAPAEDEAASDGIRGPQCANVYAKFETTISVGEPASSDGGVPVRFEVREGERVRWALGWLPTCSVSEWEGFDEGELAQVCAYLKRNALSMLEGQIGRAQ